MAAILSQIVGFFEELFPPRLAENWDNIGLQVGDPRAEVEKILITLDVTEDVVDEAIGLGVQLIFSHHPLIFKALNCVRLDHPTDRLVARLIKNDIALYTAHTNLDSAANGLNHLLAELLDLSDAMVLLPSPAEKFCKLAVFVPEDYLATVRQAICQAGAGWIGRYSCCTFSTLGQGTFLPLDGTRPFLGGCGELAKVSEFRLETIVPPDKLSQVLQALRDSHPYEEIAYDLYPLEMPVGKSGLGRVGNLTKPLTLLQLAERVKGVLLADQLKLVGPTDRMISRAAVCGGAGADLIQQAKAAGAQCLITGDVKYHQAGEAAALDLGLIDAGHYQTEYGIIQPLASYLQKESARQNINLLFLPTLVNNKPWTYL